ncbi:MAG: hypothetical protein R3F20_04450 [Planctomycetota bacterium]
MSFDDLGDFQLDINSGREGWDFPDHENVDGTITRVIWMAEGEAAAFKPLLDAALPVVEKKVVVITGLSCRSRRSVGPRTVGLATRLHAEEPPRIADAAAVSTTRRFRSPISSSPCRRIPQPDIGIRVVEVSESDTFSFGIDTSWASVEDDPNSPTATFFNTAGTLLGLPEIPGRGGTFNPGTTTPPLIDLGTISNGVQVDFLIRALKVFGRLDLLSAPHIAVLDGHSAAITAGEEILSPPRFDNSGLSSVTTTFKSVGIKLFVTPKVIGRDLIRISLTTAVEAVTGESTFQSEGATVSNPVITVREATTTMDINDGETAIIGGLLTRSKFNNENRVPVLGEIPVLNVLFSSRSKSLLVQTNLIFITPKIMDPSQERRRMIVLRPCPRATPETDIRHDGTRRPSKDGPNGIRPHVECP